MQRKTNHKRFSREKTDPSSSFLCCSTIFVNISDLILSQGDPASPAILHKEVVVTYAGLRHRVSEAARRLLSSGHAEGDRVGIFSENSPFFVAAYLGIMRAGLVAVPFQTDIGQETFEKIVTDAGIRRLFVSGGFERKVRAWADKAGVELVGDESEIQTPKSEVRRTDDRPPTIGHRLAALMFTSGSTGEPKGVMITHRNIECNTRNIIEYMGLTAADRCMVVLPFHYCFGLSLLHTHLMTGGSVVLNNDFRLYPETVLREMQEKGCTGIAGVPSTYQILLRKSRFRQMSGSFPRLRWFQQAGGKLPNACIQEIRESFPQVKYFLMYGQTEATARLSYLPPERLADKLGSIGRGLPSTKLEVLRPDGSPARANRPEIRNPKFETGTAERLMDANQREAGVCTGETNPHLSPALSSRGEEGEWEVGEIVAEGDNISPGYWGDPGETVKYFRNGKLYTGDLARVDEDGFIFIVERERDMIKSGGNRVSAKEVEDVVAEIPDVVEVAVVGAPHELLGEAIRAFVVLHPKSALKEAEILMHCRKRLPAHKNPQEVILLKSMPHNGAGKVMKKQLKQTAMPFLNSAVSRLGRVGLIEEESLTTR